MRLNELTNDYIIKKVFMYAADGNTVVRRNKKMRKVAKNIYAGEPAGDGWATYCDIYLVFDGLECGLRLTANRDDSSLDEVVEMVNRGWADTPEKLAELARGNILKDEHIPLAEVMFIAQYSPELREPMLVARQRYAEKRDQAARERKAKREAEEAAFVAERNAEAKAVVQVALEVLRKGGTLNNDDVVFYESRYHSSTYSMVNYLCRKYGIKLPLRTQGWVNDSLVNLIITNEGKCERLCYYKKKKTSRPSDVIYGYIEALCDAVRSEVPNEA